jgi:hypothetical protein
VVDGSGIEARIVAHLRERHRARAILLVGSRADGVARPGSDWDLYVLVAGEPGPQGPLPQPERFEGEWLDVGIVRLPVAPDAILPVFGPNLQEARVLLESEDGVGSALLAEARRRYALGPGLSEAERGLRRHALARTLARMRARRDEPGPFFESVAWLFFVAHRWWYEVARGRFSVSVHRALPEIAREDPEFHGALMALVHAATPEARIAAAETIERALFGAPEDDPCPKE